MVTRETIEVEVRDGGTGWFGTVLGLLAKTSNLVKTSDGALFIGSGRKSERRGAWRHGVHKGQGAVSVNSD